MNEKILLQLKKFNRIFQSYFLEATAVMVLIIIIDLIILDLGISSPVLWSFIAVVVFLEFYFKAIVRLILRPKKHYSFILFVVHLSAFTFLTIFLFALMYSYYTDYEVGNYLLNSSSGQIENTLDDTFYFSGVTLLSIGYGEIIPFGFFRMLALIEGFIGSFVILSFFSLGVTEIFIHLKKDLVREELLYERELHEIEKLQKILHNKED